MYDMFYFRKQYTRNWSIESIMYQTINMDFDYTMTRDWCINNPYILLMYNLPVLSIGIRNNSYLLLHLAFRFRHSSNIQFCQFNLTLILVYFFHCTVYKTAFSIHAGLPVSSINKADRHDIAEILLKVVLNTITLTLSPLIIS